MKKKLCFYGIAIGLLCAGCQNNSEMKLSFFAKEIIAYPDGYYIENDCFCQQNTLERQKDVIILAPLCKDQTKEEKFKITKKMGNKFILQNINKPKYYDTLKLIGKDSLIQYYSTENKKEIMFANQRILYSIPSNSIDCEEVEG